MTVITDVPQSGIYFQQGAIVQLVVQIVDITTGLPVPLQTAAGLSISILYPDGVTSQTFGASLYTDGSDGMIVYTTRNSGTTVDLSEVGLYHLQGNAAVGGVNLPPSYATDFYVEPNVVGVSPAPIFNASALILYDSSNVRWALSPSTSGYQNPVALSSGPSSFLWFNDLVMQDPSGVYWTITVSTAGIIVPVLGGSFANALQSFTLNDSNGRSWVYTVTEAGALIAS